MRLLELGWRAALDLVFPPRCVACRRWGMWLCQACREDFQRLPTPRCARCGRPWLESPCRICRPAPATILEGTRALAYFEGTLRRAIHSFKYDGRSELAGPLAALLARALESEPIGADLLVPVPLHFERRRARGYNQAALLAAELAQLTGMPLAAELLVRLRPTAPQLGLSAAQRRENVRGAFQASSERVAGRAILLIDDVTTTGATLEACAQALKRAAAGPVWGLALAKER